VLFRSGVALLGVCFLIARPLHLPEKVQAGILIPVAMFTVIIGLFIIVSRKKAITQVLGYLAMENGIYAFGAAFALQEPLVVEMGVLLDVFVGVFVMGIAIYHISREFDHIDTDRLSALKD
jgi:hydrogenase-4 component E